MLNIWARVASYLFTNKAFVAFRLARIICFALPKMYKKKAHSYLELMHSDPIVQMGLSETWSLFHFLRSSRQMGKKHFISSSFQENKGAVTCTPTLAPRILDAQTFNMQMQALKAHNGSIRASGRQTLEINAKRLKINVKQALNVQSERSTFERYANVEQTLRCLLLHLYAQLIQKIWIFIWKLNQCM